MTEKEFNEQHEIASEWFVIQDAGLLVDKYGLDVFLASLHLAVKNPEAEEELNRFLIDYTKRLG